MSQTLSPNAPVQQSIDPANRLRLVTARVRLELDGGDAATEIVNFRYAWTGADPVHTCVAQDCAHVCLASAARLASARHRGAPLVTDVKILRDRQAATR